MKHVKLFEEHSAAKPYSIFLKLTDFEDEEAGINALFDLFDELNIRAEDPGLTGSVDVTTRVTPEEAARLDALLRNIAPKANTYGLEQ